MTVMEYGKQNQDTILLFHGGGLSWWNHREAAQKLAEQYHVVLPVLDGHGDLSINHPEAYVRMLTDWIDH